MRLVHSFSSRPMLQTKRYGLGMEQLVGYIWMYSLSVAYAKRCGAEIVLHTDTMGKQILGHLPYDAIYLTLDDMPKDIHQRFWACGKFLAMKEEPTDSVHIDGDVFLKRRELIDEIEAHDFVAQSYEGGLFMPHYRAEMTYYKKLKSVSPKTFENIEWFDTESYNAYNAGVLRYNNDEFKEKFIGSYLRLAKDMTHYMSDTLDSGEFGCPDIIAEQLNYGQLAKYMNVTPHCLIGQTTADADAKAKGYQHLLSQAKYQVLDKVVQTLENVNIEIYNKTYKLCPINI